MKNYNTLLIHSDEISLKGKNRKFFEDNLQRSLARVVKTFGKAKILKEFGRFLIDVTDINTKQKKSLYELLLLTPGVSILGLSIKSKKNLDDIKKIIKENIIVEDSKTFRITTQRSDKEFPISSMECDRELGDLILTNFPNAKVDLKNPDINIHVDIGQKGAYIYTERIRGVGGIPVGSSGKMVCLLSGGIDSPVASYLMNKRGAHNIFVHFKNDTIESRAVEDKIERLVNTLSQFQGESKLYIIPFGEIQKQIIATVDARYRMLIYRRFMFRIAEKIARHYKALGLITGDSLAQVASQTLENLNCVHSVVNLFVATPLIGMNKREITDIAEKIGTYDTSILPYDDCCSMFVAKHPVTRAKSHDIIEIEKNLDIDLMVQKVINNL